MARVGAGYEERSTVDKGQYVVGVSVPMGAITLGAVFADNLQSTNSVWAVAAQYALSKRSNVNLSFSDKTGTGTGSSGINSGNGDLEGSQYQLRLLHSF